MTDIEKIDRILNSVSPELYIAWAEKKGHLPLLNLRVSCKALEEKIRIYSGRQGFWVILALSTFIFTLVESIVQISVLKPPYEMQLSSIVCGFVISLISFLTYTVISHNIFEIQKEKGEIVDIFEKFEEVVNRFRPAMDERKGMITAESIEARAVEIAYSILIREKKIEKERPLDSGVSQTALCNSVLALVKLREILDVLVIDAESFFSFKLSKGEVFVKAEKL